MTTLNVFVEYNVSLVSFGRFWRTVWLAGGVGSSESRVVFKFSVNAKNYWIRSQIHPKSEKIN